MFGSFGQTNQTQQQPAFGFGSPAVQSNQTQQTGLFGSISQQTPSLFGQNTTNQPAQTPSALNLFGGSNQQQPQQNLFGSNLSTNQATGQNAPAPLFGSTTQQASAPLFGGQITNTTTSNAPLTLFGSVPAVTTQSTLPLFGSQGTGAATNNPSLGLFGSSQQQSQTGGLFGPGGISNQNSTAFSQQGLGAMTSQAAHVTSSAFGSLVARKRNSPLEQEVPAQLLDLMKTLRTKIKENSEQLLKTVQPDVNELSEPMANAAYFLRTAKGNTSAVFSDAKEFVGKVTGDVCNCKTLIEINKQKRLHPGQSSEDLCQLLLKFGNTLHLKITRLNDKVFDLEYPLREYIEWTENGVESKIVGKQELLEHVYRIVEVCNLTFLSTSNLASKIEHLKILFMAYLRQLHGKQVKSPFAEVTHPRKSGLFEYDQEGMRAPSIFPSTTALLSLVGSMQKSVVGQQSIFTGISQPSAGSFFNPQRQFTFGPTSVSTTNSLGSGLFSKPVATASPITSTTSAPNAFIPTTTAKPTFQVPSVNVSTPSFGSTLNSSTSGTLFGGSVTKPNTLFGPK